MSESAAAFDKTYQDLRSSNQPGWGGEAYGRRLQAWEASLGKLDAIAWPTRERGRILELGCGNGMAAFILGRLGHEVYGLDVSSAAIAWAVERFNTAGIAADLRVGNVRSMPFYVDEMFDLVVDGNCLHCVIGAERALVLGEIRRIIRRGGMFLVSSMCGPPKSTEARRDYDAGIRCLIRDGVPSRFMPSPESLVQECL
ncbi:class I SAM-dependent methyltransferase, partial [Bradyrhizobium ottawaense]